MGWDYYTYMSQPSFFINEILTCIDADNTAETMKKSRE